VTATHTFFRRPRLRPGVDVDRTADGFAIGYRRQGVDLAVPPGAADEFGRLLDLLRAGAPPGELAAAAPGLGDIDGLLDELDRLGLLTEGAPPDPVRGMDGVELYRLVRRFAARLQATVCDSRLYRAMVSGEATRNQLVGYAVEYHYVVRHSPALIAPALAHAWEPAAFDILQRFLAEEIGHDQLTAGALAAAGVPVSRLSYVQPLPATASVCATLGATAAQDPLSFAACLFLVEEPAGEFNRAFAARAAEVGLPSAFIEPLLEHSGINDDAGHADVSRELLATVGYVGTEHRQAVLKQVTAMVESLARMEVEILGHYAGDELRLREFHPGPAPGTSG